MQAEETPNTLAARYPEIAAMWHPALNGDLTAEDVTPGSRKKVWWLCPKGHEWDASVGHRVRGRGCPICSGRRLAVGINDLATTHPVLANQWHPVKNGDLTPQSIMGGANKKVWWQCDEGHEWEATANKRSSGRNCPYCSNHRVTAGKNDLESQNPKLASQFHPTKNGEITPKDISISSNRKVWWQCSDFLEHSWQAIVNNRNQFNQGCPYCARKISHEGVSDLATEYPLVAAEWHPTKNGTLTPNQVLSTSHKKAWWFCAIHSYEWIAGIDNRTVRKQRCPVCVNRVIIPGVNDLGTLSPTVAKEWHPTKNGDLTPQDVSVGSDNKVWWQCSKGHEWFTWIYARIIRNCPNCAAGRSVSLGEQEVFDLITSLGYAAKQSTRISGKEVDIFIPEENIAIEFNGVYWHSEANGRGKDYHKDKLETCHKQGIRLIQVWEDDWVARKDIVVRGLLHKLGKTDKLSEVLPDSPSQWSRKVPARKTAAEEVDYVTASEFLEQNHIQGSASGSYYFALKDGESNIRAVMVVAQTAKEGCLSIERYATSGVVVGGFTKLLSYAENQCDPQTWVTFADLSISDGGLYENNGFIIDEVLAPDYSYLVRGKRVHKFNYRKARFKKDPNLLYQEEATERELAILNGIPRIWDSGKVRYVKKVDKP